MIQWWMQRYGNETGIDNFMTELQASIKVQGKKGELCTAIQTHAFTGKPYAMPFHADEYNIKLRA